MKSLWFALFMPLLAQAEMAASDQVVEPEVAIEETAQQPAKEKKPRSGKQIQKKSQSAQKKPEQRSSRSGSANRARPRVTQRGSVEKR